MCSGISSHAPHIYIRMQDGRVVITSFGRRGREGSVKSKDLPMSALPSSYKTLLLEPKERVNVSTGVKATSAFIGGLNQPEPEKAKSNFPSETFWWLSNKWPSRNTPGKGIWWWGYKHNILFASCKHIQSDHMPETVWPLLRQCTAQDTDRSVSQVAKQMPSTTICMHEK